MRRLLREVSREDLSQMARIGLFERDYARHFVRILDRLTTDNGRDLWVEKTPLHLQSIDEIARRIPGAKFLHVVRDGVDTVGSLYRAKKTYGRLWAGHRKVSGQSLAECVRRWNDDTATSLARAGARDHRIVRYEHVVADPARAARSIAEFSGIAFDERMLEGHLACRQTIRRDEPWKVRNCEPTSARVDDEAHTPDIEQRRAMAAELSPLQLDAYCECGCRERGARALVPMRTSKEGR
jgi:hypothetical protein